MDIHRSLTGLGAKALLVVAESSRDPDLAPFVGGVRLGESLLVLPREGVPHLGYLTAMERQEAAATGLALLHPEDLEVARWSREAKDSADFVAALMARALRLSHLSPGPVALAGHYRAGTVYAACLTLEEAGWSFFPGNDLVLRHRKCKTPEQVAAIRRAAAGAGAALRRVAELLAASHARGGELWLEGARLTVGRLKLEVAQVLACHGLEQPEGNIVAPGVDGAVPHTPGNPERGLRPGESLVVDLFPRGLLYADCTRTFCVGPPPEPLAQAHAAVLDALQKARRAVASGTRGWDLQLLVCGLFEAAGYPTPLSAPETKEGYVHSLGHGVGFELHEYPSFRQGSRGEEGVLAPGDVFTLEPGIYDPARGFGVRLEDLIYLGDKGVEHLTNLPSALDPREWLDS